MVTKADNPREWIFVVDGDSLVRETLQASGMRVLDFCYPAECLVQMSRKRCDLLITDLETHQTNGLRLLEQVKARAPWIPVLIVTEHGDIPAAVRAIKGGAAGFIEKPFKNAFFIQAVKGILRQSRMAGLDAVRALTPKEVEVFRLIIEGRTNREIAEQTDRHVKTVEAHRARIMQKLGTRNVVDLLRLGAAMGLVLLPTTQQSAESTLQTKECSPQYWTTGDGALSSSLNVRI